jgi:hypothetical protein
MALVTTGLLLSLDSSNPASYPGSGSTWYDLSGNGYNFTLINAPTYVAGQFLSFNNGLQQQARIAGAPPLLANWYSADYTCCFWVYNNQFFDSLNGYEVGFGNSETNNVQYWTLGTNHFGTVGFYYYNGSQINVPTSFTCSIDIWYYLSLVQTGGIIYIYVNGSLVLSTPVSGTPQSSPYYPLSLGGTSGFMNGLVYTVQVYNIALTSDQIVQNYSTNQPGPPVTPPAFVNQNAILSVNKSTSVQAQVNQNAILALNNVIPNANVNQNAILVAQGLTTSSPPANVTQNAILSVSKSNAIQTNVTQNSIQSISKGNEITGNVTQNALLVLQRAIPPINNENRVQGSVT